VRVPEVFLDGLHLPECPRWHAGALWFSDMWDHTVWRIGADGGGRTAVHRFGPDEDPGGLGWLPDGTLLVVGMDGRRVYRLTPDGAGGFGAPAVHADLAAVAPWPCNDMITTADGTAFVSHFGFDMWGKTTGFLPATLLRVRPDGTAAAVVDDVSSPNGMALSADGRSLFLSECGRSSVLRFTVGADGELTDRSVFATLTPAPDAPMPVAPPDGICLDEAGAVWAAEPIGKRVLRIEPGGTVTDEIPYDVHPLAVVLGGPDRRTLFVCASGQHDRPNRDPRPLGRIDSLRVEVPGAGAP
jgi:sugar lactone lactonase YvrE